MADKINSEQLQEIIAVLGKDRHSEAAWTKLYKLVWPFVVATIFRALGGQTQNIEDTAQEVFIRLIRFCDFNAFANSAAFLGYLHAICQNVSRDLLRIKPPIAVEDDFLERLPSPRSDQSSVDSRLTLKKVFGDLSDDELDLAKHLLNGYTLKEIAKLTRQPYGTLAVRFHRLRSRLKPR